MLGGFFYLVALLTNPMMDQGQALLGVGMGLLAFVLRVGIWFVGLMYENTAR